ncbi:hypothetical protein Hanom_Chr04g00282941 [Helianthus anomalus]
MAEYKFLLFTVGSPVWFLMFNFDAMYLYLAHQYLFCYDTWVHIYSCDYCLVLIIE